MKPLIQVKHLKKLYPLRGGLLSSLLPGRRLYVRAVDDISFAIEEGEVLGLVGESGCGKTTVGRLLDSLEYPTSGSIYYEGVDIIGLGKEELKQFRRSMQMIFQDPYESLDPRYTVGRTLLEPLTVQKIGSAKEERMDQVKEMLERVELGPPEDFLYRYPHELSGGQRQRVTIARTMILHPRLVLADEPVSMLDVSVRSGILNLMLRMKDELRVTYLFITHDLAVARYMSDRIAVMYLGKIVELGPKEEVIQNHEHPYTELLLSAVPEPDPTVRRRRSRAKGEVLTISQLPSGCRFHPRCPYAKELCGQVEPDLIEIAKDHYVACHHPLKAGSPYNGNAGPLGIHKRTQR